MPKTPDIIIIRKKTINEFGSGVSAYCDFPSHRIQDNCTLAAICSCDVPLVFGEEKPADCDFRSERIKTKGNK